MNTKARENETAALVIEVLVTAIEPHPENPRTFPKDDSTDAGLVDLAASIKAVGLLEPVLLRPVTNASTRGQGYQLVAGERRWRASRLAGLDRIPAIVRVLDDRQTLEIQVIENLQRKDLAPLEEARGVRALVDRAGWTVQDVADRLGRSLHWVAQRARLTELSPAWQKEVADPKSLVSAWPAAWLVMMARLDGRAQEALHKEQGRSWRERAVSSSEVADAVADMTRLVRSAPWPAGDAALYPTAGACSGCHKRSSANPGLFEDEDLEAPAKTDRCLDAVCWTEKKRRHLAAREAKLRAEHPKLLLLHGDYDRADPRDSNREGVLHGYQVSPAKKSDAGARPALVVDGRGAGTIRWVMPPESRSAATRPKGPDGNPAPKPMKERREALDRRRKAKAVEIIRDHVEKASTPATDLLIQLAAVFGTSNRRDGYYFDGYDDFDDKGVRIRSENVWKFLARLDAESMNGTSSRDLLWQHVRQVMAHRLQYMGSQTDMKKLWDDAEHQCEVLGIDAAAALASTTAAIPEPKSWAALNANGTPKGSKPAKAKKGTKAAPAPKAKKPRKPKTKAGVCRVCGCTEDNACEALDGEPCHWVEPDLCSACVEDGSAVDPDDELQEELDKDEGTP